jgi:hypothetical protein
MFFMLRNNLANYEPVVEPVYTKGNCQVINWTKYFSDILSDKAIFSRFTSPEIPKTLQSATVVANSWHLFSSFMPWFLCTAAAKVSTNFMRHYIIQTAFEELGMRDHKEIHPDMFWDAAKTVGVKQSLAEIQGADSTVQQSIDYLRRKLLHYGNDAKILGILLGLEIPAQENIETIYNCLAYNNVCEKRLAGHRFFIIHRKIEIEHVRLSVSNFLRFCTKEQEKADFIHGFNDGLYFWNCFWTGVKKLLHSPHSSKSEEAINERTI